MRKPNVIEKETTQIGTVRNLTSVFESLASSQVAKVKDKVTTSEEFFRLLWKRYSSIRVDRSTRITDRGVDDKLPKKVFIIISSETSLSGSIDQRLVETMQQDYDPETTDIIVIGSHGATQLTQHGIPFVRFFQVLESDRYVDVSPIIDAVIPYSKMIVYYEEYISLGIQEIKSIDLISTLQDMSEGIEDDVTTANNTIFEPSLSEIADQMETTMMKLALSQTILESSLAQAASRFSAMAIAKEHASKLIGQHQLEFHRAKRFESDRKMREVLISLKEKRKRLGVTR